MSILPKKKSSSVLYKIVQNATFTTVLIYILQLELTLGARFIKPQKNTFRARPMECYTTNSVSQNFSILSKISRLISHFAQRPTIPT